MTDTPGDTPVRRDGAALVEAEALVSMLITAPGALGKSPRGAANLLLLAIATLVHDEPELSGIEAAKTVLQRLYDRVPQLRDDAVAYNGRPPGPTRHEIRPKAPPDTPS
jgi:hypothetical protein